MRQIAKRIRRTRELRGIPSTEIARQIEVSRPYYSLLETGKRRLSAEHVWKIAKVLDVSVAELYGETESRNQEEDRRSVLGSGEHMRLINPTRLRRHLRPLLRDQTEDVVDCIGMMVNSPAPLRQAVKAFYESYRNAS